MSLIHFLSCRFAGLTTLALAFTLLTSSCNNPEVPRTAEFAAFETVTNPPTVWDGMLQFTNQDHYDQVALELSQMIETDKTPFVPGETDYVIPNFVLDRFESMLGFASLRKKQEAITIKNLSGGMDILTQNPDDYFIRGDVTRALLNPDLEVRIGTAITRIIDKNVGIVIEDGDYATLLESRQNPIAVMAKSNVRVKEVGYINDIIDWEGPTCSMTVVATTADCPNPNLIDILASFNPGTAPWNGTNWVFYQWNWGDGSTSMSSSFGPSHSLSHSFPGAGTYTVNVTSTFKYGAADWCTSTQSLLITVGENCDLVPRSDFHAIQLSNNPDRAIRGDIWTERSNFPQGIFATTKYYRRNGSGKWVVAIAPRIETEIDGNVKNADCTPFGGIGNINSKSISHIATARVKFYNSDWAHIQDGVWSNHRARHNGVWTVFQLFLPYQCN